MEQITLPINRNLMNFHSVWNQANCLFGSPAPICLSARIRSNRDRLLFQQFGDYGFLRALSQARHAFQDHTMRQ